MKIIIVGGGKVGFYLAQTLSAQGHEAAIIEQDRELCRMIANQLDISICTGDGTSQDVLREAGAERADVVCAVTGKDESNLVCCQTAKKVFDVKKTVAKVNNPNNVAALRTLGVDTVVSSTDNIIEHLEREVDISAMKELIPLDGGDASLQEITLPDDRELAGKSLMELSTRIIVNGVMQTDSLYITTWKICWTIWNSTCPMNSGLPKRCAPTSKSN